MAVFALVKAKYLQQIADVLRARLGTQSSYYLKDMADAVYDINTAPLSDYTAPANTHGETYCIANKTDINNLADAIREKLETYDTFTMSEMAAAILSIDGAPIQVPEYSDYDFELHAYNTQLGTAANVYFDDGVKAQWSNSSGTNMVKLFTVPNTGRYLIFYGCATMVENPSDYSVIGTFPVADFSQTSGVQIATDYSWAYIQASTPGAVLYATTTGTLAVKYNSVVNASQIHVINFNALVASAYKSQVIFEEGKVQESSYYRGVLSRCRIQEGYGWRATSSYNYLTHFYDLQQGHSYAIVLEGPVDYLAYIMTTIDLSDRQSNYQGGLVIREVGNNPSHYFIYDGGLKNVAGDYYLAICTSTQGDSTNIAYLLDITAFK